MTGELSFPRQFGEYVLVAQLGDDGLGTVYRALHSSDERRFVRLRILQSPELSPEAVCAAIRKNASRATALAHKAIVLRLDMGIIDTVPYVAWYEGAGWTLDLVLAKLRAAARQIPVEYALLITERAAAALSHAWLSVTNAEPFHHGLIWPGFISISNDAEVRVGGFGLAEAVLPALGSPRLQRDIAPFVAPEVRASGKVSANSDVYSLGVLLLELLTCRRPTLERRTPGLRAGDPFAAEVSACLRSAFAEAPERFSSVVQMHRVLQELLAESPYAISTASFGVFLYNLLNLEGQLLPVADGDTTNPIEIEPLPGATGEALAKEPEESSASGSADRRQRMMTPLLPSAAHDEASFPRPAPEPVKTEPSEPPDGSKPLPPVVLEQASEVASEESRQKETFPEVSGKEAPQKEIFTELMELGQPPERRPFSKAIRIAVAAAAVALAVLGATKIRTRSRTPVPLTPVAVAPAPNAVSAASPPPLPQAPVPVSAARATQARKMLASAPRRRSARKAEAAAPASRPQSVSKPATTEDPERRSADASRLGAALARIGAERLEAGKLSPQTFASGRKSEQEGEGLLTERNWSRAQASFERAAALFREAESEARQERVRRVKLLPADQPQ